jgi:MoaA/NifB/PqqE/SkfB family radical SAM enzyme
MPVFTKDKKLSHTIGNYTGSTDFDELLTGYLNSGLDPMRPIKLEQRDYKIKCYAKERSQIYVSANGEVYPCCWLGFYPMHTNHSPRPSNAQLKPIVVENNALTYTLDHTIKWFNKVEDTWDKTVPNGKIYICNETCGVKN